MGATGQIERRESAASAQPGRDHGPGVIVRPPRLYIGALLAGIVLDYLWPVPALGGLVPGLARSVIGAGLVALGVWLMGAALRYFRRAGTPVETYRATSALVTEGTFARSRNPMYVSLTLLYGGIGLALDNAWVLGLLVPLVFLMRHGVIAREERYLERRFGARYLAYKAAVRRWL